MIGCDVGLPSLSRVWVYFECRRKSELRIWWPEGSLWQTLTRCSAVVFLLPEHTRIMHFSTSVEVRRTSCDQHLINGMLSKWCMLFPGLLLTSSKTLCANPILYKYCVLTAWLKLLNHQSLFPLSAWWRCQGYLETTSWKCSGFLRCCLEESCPRELSDQECLPWNLY